MWKPRLDSICSPAVRPMYMLYAMVPHQHVRGQTLEQVWRSWNLKTELRFAVNCGLLRYDHLRQCDQGPTGQIQRCGLLHILRNTTNDFRTYLQATLYRQLLMIEHHPIGTVIPPQEGRPDFRCIGLGSPAL
jgi:hypothetical protein